MIACDRPLPSRTDDVLLAEVHKRQLYLSDLEEVMPDYNDPSDSLTIKTAFVNKWIRENLILEEAEKVVSVDINIEQLVDDYRNSLLKSNFEKLISDRRLDTVVTMQQISNYIDQNPDQFVLTQSIVNLEYVKVAENKRGLDAFYDHWKSGQVEFLETYCKKNCKEYDITGNLWLYKQDIKKTIPQKVFKALKWEDKFQVQKNVDKFEYFIRILEFREKNTPAPAEIVADKVTKVILHQRKKNVFNTYIEELFDREVNNKNVTIH